MKAWIAAVALGTMMVSAAACATDGNDLLSECNTAIRAMDKNTQVDYDVGHCLGIIQGVLGTASLMGRTAPKNMRVCLPKSGVKGQQAIRVTVKFLEANPKLLNEDASMLILLALTDAFPCQ